MLKKLKSLFIIQDESAKTEKPGGNKQPATSAGTAKPTKKTGPKTKTPAAGEEGKVSDRFLKVLLGAMQENDLDGFDYLEYKDFLRSLDKVNMDASTQYRSAFATAQTMGATVDKIRESAQHYIDILKGERSKFEDAVTKRRTQVLEAQKASIVRLEESVTKKKAQIEKLKQEIDDSIRKIEQKKKEFAASESKVDKTNADFIHTYNLLVEQIQEDVNNINTYLS